MENQEMILPTLPSNLDSEIENPQITIMNLDRAFEDVQEQTWVKTKFLYFVYNDFNYK